MIAAIFDTETTGIPAGDFSPEIVEIAVLLLDQDTGRELAAFHTIVRPGDLIPEITTQFHGISDELAQSYGMPRRMAENVFMELVKLADVVVAHNLEFDLQIVELNWPDAYAMLQTKEHYCTMLNGMDVLKLPGGTYHGKEYEHKPPNLKEAVLHLTGREMTNHHNAMADTIACRNVYTSLLYKQTGKHVPL